MSIFKIIEKEFNKEYKLLNEGIEEVKKYYPKIPDSDFMKLIALDPTYRGGNELGKYGKWILNLYNNFLKDKIAFQKWEEQKKLGNNYPEPIRKSQEQIEDFDKIPNLLKDFDVINQTAKINIDTIKSTSDLYKIINDAKNQGVSTNSKVNYAINLVKKSVSKGGKVVFKDSNWIVLIPETLESSCVFGNDTNWCTTSPNGNMYNYYKDEHGGQYFINLNLQTGELYQFHFESEQFMDKNDNQISIRKLIDKDVKLKKFYLNYLYDNYKSNKKLAYFILQLDENPSEQVQLAAVKQMWYIIQYIKNPTEQVQLEAVKKTGYAIRYIKNPIEQVQLEAVKQDGLAIEYIKNPTEQVQLEAVKKTGYAIEYIKNPSEQIQLEAVKQNGRAIQFINNPTEEMKLAAVKQNGWAIVYIKNPSEQIQLEAVKQNGRAIQYINNPSEQIQLAAVKENGLVIEYIKNPSEKVQLEAVKENSYAIQYIKNPTDKVKALYKKLYGKINEAFEPKLNDNFKKWFGNSKVVDENGNPLVCYHETNVDFNSFDISKQSHTANLGYGFYFSSEPFWSNLNVDMKYRKECYLRIKNPFDATKRYTIEEVKFLFDNDVYNDIIKNSELKGKYTLYNLFCDAISYLFYDSEKYNGIDDKQWYKMIYNNFQKAGYDGIKRRNYEYGMYEYVVFNPNQIKSVNNNGNWSLESNNINESLEPKLNDNFWKWFGNSKVVDENGNPLVVYHGSPTMKVYNKNYLDNINKLLQRMYDYKGISDKFEPITIDKIFGWKETIQEFINQNPNFKISKEELEGINQFIDFDSFDITKRGLNTSFDYNSGFFFTDNKEDAETFESHISTNEFGGDEKIYTPNTAGTKAFYLSLKNPYIGKNISNKAIKKYQDMGYDGIINTMTNMKRLGRNIKKEYIAFYPNQIKSVDNNGNWSTTSNNINEAGVKALKTRKIPTFIGKSEEETRKGLKDRLKPLQYDIFIDYYDNGLSLDELSKKYDMDIKKLKTFIMVMRKKVSNFDPNKPLNPNIDYENGRFKKGANPWNKDKRGYMGANKTSFTTDTIKHAEIGKPRQGHQHLVTATAEKVPVKDKHSGKTYMVHKRESYPRWLLKQNGIDVPSNCVVWHIDGDYNNNDLDNLEVITRAESIRRTLHNKGKK